MKRIKDIEGFELVDKKYYITTCGKIIILKENGKTLITKPNINKKGYYQMKLCYERNYKECVRPYIHKLVALAFVENDDKMNKTQVDHIDMNLTHNYINNLEWVTPRENQNRKNSIKPSMSKLSKEDVEYIRNHQKRWREGKIWKSNTKQLAKKFGVSEKVITNCANHLSYKLF